MIDMPTISFVVLWCHKSAIKNRFHETFLDYLIAVKQGCTFYGIDVI